MKLTLKLTVLTMLVFIGAYMVPVTRMHIEETAGGLLFGNQDVETKEGVSKILADFPTIRQSELPDAFLDKAGITTSKFRRLSPKTFYVLRKKDLYRKVAGHLRIVDLFARDAETLSGFWWSDGQR